MGGRVEAPISLARKIFSRSFGRFWVGFKKLWVGGCGSGKSAPPGFNDRTESRSPKPVGSQEVVHPTPPPPLRHCPGVGLPAALPQPPAGVPDPGGQPGRRRHHPPRPPRGSLIANPERGGGPLALPPTLRQQHGDGGAALVWRESLPICTATTCRFGKQLR